MLPVNPPHGLALEAWLSRWARPSSLPAWPHSPCMALVVVEESAKEDDPQATMAFLVTTEAELEQINGFPRRLYFRVPRSILGDLGLA